MLDFFEKNELISFQFNEFPLVYVLIFYSKTLFEWKQNSDVNHLTVKCEIKVCPASQSSSLSQSSLPKTKVKPTFLV